MLRPHILFIDNFDSFTFNLVDALACLGADIDVYRNDIGADTALTIAQRKQSALIVLSPGPGTPAQAGCSQELISRAAGKFPLLGICLGHQAIAETFGGRVAAADTIVHGKKSRITHNGHPVFDGLPTSFDAARYHSLTVKTLPRFFQAIATLNGQIMALAHQTLPIYGMQFHPESILTAYGQKIIENIFQISKSYQHSTVH